MTHIKISKNLYNVTLLTHYTHTIILVNGVSWIPYKDFVINIGCVIWSPETNILFSVCCYFSYIYFLMIHIWIFVITTERILTSSQLSFKFIDKFKMFVSLFILSVRSEWRSYVRASENAIKVSRYVGNRIMIIYVSSRKGFTKERIRIWDC